MMSQEATVDYSREKGREGEKCAESGVTVYFDEAGGGLPIYEED